MSYFFHPEALSEYKESAKFYKNQRTGLGKSYVLEIEQAAIRASEDPKHFRAVFGRIIRKVAVGNFPYTIYFREADGSVQILAVAHNRRRPGYWQDRI